MPATVIDLLATALLALGVLILGRVALSLADLGRSLDSIAKSLAQWAAKVAAKEAAGLHPERLRGTVPGTAVTGAVVAGNAEAAPGGPGPAASGSELDTAREPGPALEETVAAIVAAQRALARGTVAPDAVTPRGTR